MEVVSDQKGSLNHESNSASYEFKALSGVQHLALKITYTQIVSVYFAYRFLSNVCRFVN